MIATDSQIKNKNYRPNIHRKKISQINLWICGNHFPNETKLIFSGEKSISEFHLIKNLKDESAVNKFLLQKIFHTLQLHKRPNFNAVERYEIEFKQD